MNRMGEMEAVAEGLWGLSEQHERRGDAGKAIKCMEAICQSTTAGLYPIVEVKVRLRTASLLLRHSHNASHAKSHLERASLLLSSLPHSFHLRCRALSLLTHSYHLLGSIAAQKHSLRKALDLCSDHREVEAKLWSCNFNSQLANAFVVEGDYQSSFAALNSGFVAAAEISRPELQMFFATSILHVHLMQWEDESVVQAAVDKCDQIWETVQTANRKLCLGLLFYNKLLQIFYRLRICDYKNAAQLLDKLDAAMKSDLQQSQHVADLTAELEALNRSLSRDDLHARDRSALSGKRSQLEETLKGLTNEDGLNNRVGSLGPAYFGNMRRGYGDKLLLAPPPIDGEWLPKRAVYALVDLMIVILGRPKGLFKECGRRIQSGMQTIQDELAKLGITDGVIELNLHHSAIWMAGVYLMLLMQFLENKVVVELTRSEFLLAQEALIQMKNWYMRFPTILQASEGIIEALRGQYAHTVGCYSEAAFHYLEAAKLTTSKSMQAICQVYAAVSYICIGDAESSSQALDLVGPVYRTMDSFVGVREKTSVLFAYGLLLMKQHDLQEARNRLARGLQLTHNHLGNLQMVSQYLTILGSLALSLHDNAQAREILKSSLTLAKKLSDIPTQIWVLSVLTTLYQELGEKGNEMENADYQRKKVEELQKRLASAHSSIHHLELIENTRFDVSQFHDLGPKHVVPDISSRADLDIPESVGFSTPLPNFSSRLVDLDTGRRGKRRI